MTLHRNDSVSRNICYRQFINAVQSYQERKYEEDLAFAEACISDMRLMGSSRTANEMTRQLAAAIGPTEAPSTKEPPTEQQPTEPDPYADLVARAAAKANRRHTRKAAQINTDAPDFYDRSYPADVTA